MMKVQAQTLVGMQDVLVTVPTWKGEVTVKPETEILRMEIGGREVVTFDWTEGGTAYFAGRTEGVFLDPAEEVTLH